MKHEITTLDNGLRIVTATMHESQSVSASIYIGTGSRYETAAENGGVSHFLEHLLFKGTKKRPSAKEIAEEIDAVGGYNNAWTSNDLTNYYVKVPKAHAALALDILTDMLTGSLLDPTEIDRERGVIIEEMNVYRDDPSRYIYRLVPGLLWPGNALSDDVIGSEEVITNITRDQIVDYMTARYQPNNLVVAVAGKITHQEVVDQISEALGKLENATKLVEFEPVGDKLAEKLSELHFKDTAQAHFVIAARAYAYRHDNDAAARLLTNILGWGMSSRLFINVRERKGLAYSVTASLSNFVDTGMFEAYAGVNLDKINEAIAAVMEELKLIATEPISAKELSKAKNQVRGSMLMAMESNYNVSSRLGEQLILLGSIESIEDQLARIDAVTAEDIRRVASEMLAPERLRLAIIAPEGLAKAGEAEFERLVKQK